ncbi:hypothetical protein B0A53_05505 [Rhodotorula sp. CCFEE 5036]|nr:hypothetical protein B0A53_05505 [Rhodotorula sp. CCFEE 5036]
MPCVSAKADKTHRYREDSTASAIIPPRRPRPPKSFDWQMCRSSGTGPGPLKDRGLTDPPNRKMKIAVAPLWRNDGVKITASMASAEATATAHKKKRRRIQSSDESDDLEDQQSPSLMGDAEDPEEAVPLASTSCAEKPVDKGKHRESLDALHEVEPQPVDKGKHRVANPFDAFLEVEPRARSVSDADRMESFRSARSQLYEESVKMAAWCASHYAPRGLIKLLRDYTVRVNEITDALVEKALPEALAQQVFSSPVTREDK